MMRLLKYLYRVLYWDQVDPARWWFSADGQTRVARTAAGIERYKKNALTFKEDQNECYNRRKNI